MDQKLQHIQRANDVTRDQQASGQPVRTLLLLLFELLIIDAVY